MSDSGREWPSERINPQPTALTDEVWDTLRDCVESMSAAQLTFFGCLEKAKRVLSRRTAEPQPAAAEPPANVLYEDSNGGLHRDLGAAEPSPTPQHDATRLPLADDLKMIEQAPVPAPCRAYNHAEKEATKEGCECRKTTPAPHPKTCTCATCYAVSMIDDGPSPAPSGDVIDRMCGGYGVKYPGDMHAAYAIASADLLAHPPAEWLDSVDAAIRDNYVAHGMSENKSFRDQVRARLIPQLRDRVTVTANAEVLIDGKSIGTFVTITDALKYASIRRAELAKEAADGK